MSSSSSAVTTVTSREFAHDLARVKRVAAHGTVFITDRGEPKYALMPIDEYRRLAGERTSGRSLLDLMRSLPSTSGIEMEAAPLAGTVRPVDLD